MGLLDKLKGAAREARDKTESVEVDRALAGSADKGYQDITETDISGGANTGTSVDTRDRGGGGGSSGLFGELVDRGRAAAENIDAEGVNEAVGEAGSRAEGFIDDVVDGGGDVGGGVDNSVLMGDSGSGGGGGGGVDSPNQGSSVYYDENAGMWIADLGGLRSRHHKKNRAREEAKQWARERDTVATIQRKDGGVQNRFDYRKDGGGGGSGGRGGFGGSGGVDDDLLL